MAFGNIFKGRKILITGHCGFKGSWLSLWLNKLGAYVYGYSLKNTSEFTAYESMGISDILADEKIGDIRDAEDLELFFSDVKPEIVLHLAAQPLVRLSYKEPLSTYQTNVIGTLNVLEASRKNDSVKAFVNVTTDKCYENLENGRAYKEDDAMGGYDMYSSSKGCSEILTSSYRNSFLKDEGFALASGRAGNVIGGGDWAEDRLIPDCIKALSKGEEMPIRNPDSVRPWQHVLEPLAGYLSLARALLESPKDYSTGFNFGPDSSAILSVGDIVEILGQEWGDGKWHNKEEKSAPHEAKLLSLDIHKAEKMLGVRPVLNANEAVSMTAKWYKSFYGKQTNMRDFSISQISEFTEKARSKNIKWSL